MVFMSVRMKRLVGLCWLLVWLVASAARPWAATLPAPTSGLEIVYDHNGHQHHETLSPQDLLRLAPQKIRTHTVVTDGSIEFEGVWMRDVLAQAPVRGDEVIAIALNDYRINIPTRDFDDFDVLLAWVADGKVLEAHNKGPFWIIYPRDDHQELQDIRYDTRWVWQLLQLQVQ